jgi:hypothetical protein
MKKLLITSISLMSFTLFNMSSKTGCKKETVTQTVTKTDTVYQCQTSIKGLWIGTYTVNSIPAQGQLFYSLSVYPDGSLLYKTKDGVGNSYYARGTWALSGSNIFSATVKSFATPIVTQTITANYSNSLGLTNGTWADISGGTNSGNLQFMVKTY